jgi:hypothetical protein
MLTLLVEVALVVVAWKRHWRGWVLVLVGLALVVKVLIGLHGGATEAFTCWWVEVPCEVLGVLIALRHQMRREPTIGNNKRAGARGLGHRTAMRSVSMEQSERVRSAAHENF